ncbi:phosphatase PAP2 family protein [bacterium]|nr:MAG: phosphatase PAP2 family protein [bacterium]
MSPVEREPFLAWPTWPAFRRALALSAGFALLFALVYGGADRLTSLHSVRWRVDLPGELAIPFFAPLSAVYLSMNVVLALGPWVLRREGEFEALVWTLTAELCAAGIFFVLFPAALKFPQPDVTGFWGPFFKAADTLNLDHNLFPSLHVAFACTTAAAFGARRGPTGRAALNVWAAAVAASTVLTHQHHILDVVGGVALAAAAHRYVHRRFDRMPA